MRQVALCCVLLCTYIAAFPQNPLLLKDVSPSSTGGTIQQIVKTSNYTFFNENDGGAATDRSLYRTDGTSAGTIKLNLSYPGYISTKADKLTALGNKIVFAGDNIAGYGEIWASDGTQAGTVAIERFQPIDNKVPVVEINSMGSYTYYSVIDKDAGNINRAYLKRTDGSAAGTSLVYDFSAFAGLPQVVFLTPMNGILYFIVYDQGGTGADQLWRSDGTNAGTYMVYNFTTANAVASFLMVAGNNIYVMTVSPGVGNILWKSDGTAAGTAQVKTIRTTPGGNNYPRYLAIGTNLFFAGLDGNGNELWVTDGTTAGTNMVADINPGAAGSNPINFTALNNTLYFSANNGTNGVELWKYNGTVATMVEDILPGSGSSSPSFLVESNGTIMFQATNGITGNELWITDGTAANTKLVADINPTGSSLPNLLTPGNPVYFAANDGVNGFEVFKYDNSGGIQNIKTKLYVNDNNTAGDVFATAIGNNANAGTAAAPYASLQYAVSQATPGAVIYVDAGTFSEQVIIDKAVTIIGAGQTLTFFTPPSSSLVPAPGPFSEIGLFETTQNIGDVHISGLSINSNNTSQNIIIQSGGSVKNCTLLNGNQGIFFRIESATKTALIENNTIQPTGIGINCQGSGLTTIIRNNNITKPSGMYSGIFAGLDFGPLPQLTVQNNIINNYFGDGMLVSSYNGTYTSNSFTGTGSFAINRNGNGGNTPTATCNWFGSADAGTVASKINGNFIYTPFLTDGTDASSNIGFQPAVSCPPGNTWYVNNNSLNGDVFTTAIGSNANAGTQSAPFATIQYAVNAAAANDLIYVDAGTYTEQVTITKGITIIGAGQNLTSILKPATTVAPPGPFTEQAVIQTAQNIGDVNIKDLSVTGNLASGVSPIIIQSGGSVRNCKLQGGNQGLFVRVDAATNPSAKTFAAEGNQFDAEYIALNFEGANITGTVNNNTLTVNNPGFSAGMFAFVNRITVTNNLFNKYISSGIQISASTSASITQNAFTGAGALAINRTGGANVTANCNWYGVTNAASVITKVNAGVNYYPWFIDGTDASTQPGFQHNETCGASSNVYFVNDNSTTGDLFTTVVGNDANEGTTPTSPLATIDAALTKASPGATIYVDAGTYSAQNTTISKQVQIIGTNYNTSPNSSSDPLLINPVRNTESIIDNSTWIIGADGISITGLTFTPTGNAVSLVNTSFGNITLSRNRLRLNSIFPAFVLNGAGTGASISSLVNWNLIINENRFEKEDASLGNSVRINKFGGVNIYNNSFVVTGTTERTQNSIVIGNAGVVAYLTITNNVFDKAATALNTNSLGYTNINKNTFSNTGSAFVGNNSFAESSDVLFTNNTLDGSTGIVPFVQYTRQGGNAVGATSSFKVEGNTISGTAIAGTTTLLGSMNLIFMNSVLNPSLTIRNNKITYAGDLSTVPAHLIRPIMVRGNLLNAIIEKNEINLTGFNQQPKTAGIDLPVSPAITLHPDNGSNSFLQSGSVVNILNNKINGFKNSFAVYDATNGRDTYIGYGNIYPGVTVNVNNNSFTSDSISINNGTIPAANVINASCNWYGSAAAQDFIKKLTLATVNIVPWLTNGTDTDVATGFQPVPNSCDGYPTLITLNSSTNVTCNGTANGSINITTSYGKTPFTYTWTKVGDATFISNAEDPTGLAAGTYRLSITDGNGSNVYITDPEANGPGVIEVTITEPATLTATASGSNNLCYGQLNGSAAVVAQGGTEPYSYSWSNGSTGDAISNLAAGTYTVTVTDANGCTNTASYEVTQPALLTASITNNSTACSNKATVLANGGTANYTYSWSNGATTPSISDVPVGTYTVTVTDANGCTATASISLTVSEPFNPSASVTNVSCFNGNNGIITITNANGTAPFTFSKNGGSFEPGSLPYSFTNLTAGTYTIAVRDANGCTGFVTKTVLQPTALTVSGTVQSTCYNQSTGSITVTVSGGTPAYSYSWSGLNGSFTSTQSNISNLAAGNYTLTVTDKNGCKFTLPLAVTSRAEILVNEIVNNVTCRGAANGSISVNASGGSGGSFGYLWNTGATTNSISNLAPGNYSVRITDNGSGCVVNKSYTITQPASALSLSTAKTNATGCNSLGTITATGSGGTAPYTYTINGTPIGANTIKGLYAGDYTVTVTDANGCSVNKVVSITDNGSDEYEGNNSKNQAKVIPFSMPVLARIALATDAADWFKFTTGTAGNYVVFVTHPSINFTYNLYAAGNNTAALTPYQTNASGKWYALPANTTYFVSITGGLSYNCYTLLVTQEVNGRSAPITAPVLKATEPEVRVLGASVYPNPHHGNFTLNIESPEQGTAVVEMFTVNGQKLSERKVDIVKGKGNAVKYKNMNYAILFYRVRMGTHIVTGKIISPN